MNVTRSASCSGFVQFVRLPERSVTHTSYVPLNARSEPNAIFVPSGEKCGSRSSPCPEVSWRTFVPSEFITQMWKVPPLYA